MHTIHTDRLTLTPIHDDDLQALHDLWTLPSVRQYLWDDHVIDRAQTQDIIAQCQNAEDARGLWLIHQETTLVGFCGFWPFHEPVRMELLFGLHPAHIKRGYATEAARAMITYARAHLDMTTILASTDVENKASIAVLERLGMILQETAMSGELETCFYTTLA